MKLYVLSDLHIECSDFTPARTGADVVVLAGDIGVADQGLEWAAKHMAAGGAFYGKPVIYVSGNHELYRGGQWTEVPQNLRARAEQFGIHFLECDQITIGGVRFLGCTLWTDGEVYLAYRQEAISAMGAFIADFRGAIRHGENFLTPDATFARHREHRAWLERELGEPWGGKTVVITHHLPSTVSIAKRYHGDLTNAAFASDLGKLVERVDVWVHGHTHCSFDYRLPLVAEDPDDGCRVVCNPRGYTSYERPSPENAEFKADLVIDV